MYTIIHQCYTFNENIGLAFIQMKKLNNEEVIMKSLRKTIEFNNNSKKALLAL